MNPKYRSILSKLYQYPRSIKQNSKLSSIDIIMFFKLFWTFRTNISYTHASLSYPYILIYSFLFYISNYILSSKLITNNSFENLEANVIITIPENVRAFIAVSHRDRTENLLLFEEPWNDLVYPRVGHFVQFATRVAQIKFERPARIKPRIASGFIRRH